MCTQYIASKCVAYISHTERRGHIDDDNDSSARDKKPVGEWIQSNGVVRDGNEDKREKNVDRQVSQGFT
jgi:hypothetical protein